MTTDGHDNDGDSQRLAAATRLHLVEVLLNAREHAAEIVELVMNADGAPHEAVMQRFGVSREDADAIVDQQIKHLGQRRLSALREEQADLTDRFKN